ncbi:MAG: hypothetical protein KTR27_13460, partial [Leptolyngbyaceae cyanobacterium MAG.088]|nr:hypothetical protein [Leptolyngbyaceae cyanobacterium MAG.088]
LSGKLLGVPVCLYLAVGLVVPLQWFTGLNAGYGIGQMLGFYLTLIAQTLIFYLGALLISLSVSNLMVLGLQPWLLAAGVIGFNWLMFNYAVSREFFGNTESHVFLWSVLFSPFSSLAYFNVEQSNVGSNFDLTLGDFQLNFTAYGLLALVHAAGWYALLGHGLERRFSNADNTLLKRRFSYFLTLIFAAFMLGLTGIQVRETYDEPLHLFLMALLSLVYFVMLIMALSPARQTLKDWTRFCHARPPHERLPLWKDLIIGDTSSPVVAIALNLLLLNSLVLTFFCSRFNNFLSSQVDGLVFVCCILMFIGSILFSAVVSQTLLMLPRKKNWVWLGAVGSISCLAFPALSVGMAFAVLEPYPRPAHVLGMPPEVAVLALPLSLLVTVTTVLGFIHTRQLIRSGHSESQQLLSQT